MAKSHSKTLLLLLSGAALALALLLLLVLRDEPESAPGESAEAPVDLGAAFPAPPSPGELSAPVEVELSGPARVEGREAETSASQDDVRFRDNVTLESSDGLVVHAPEPGRQFAGGELRVAAADDQQVADELAAGQRAERER